MKVSRFFGGVQTPGMKKTRNLSGEAKTASTSDTGRDLSSHFDTVELSDRAQSARSLQGHQDHAEQEAAFQSLFDGAAEKLDAMLRPDTTRRHAYAADTLGDQFANSLHTWMHEARSLPAEQRQSYLNEQSERWVTKLRDDSPEDFHRWLEKSRPAVQAGHFDRCVLPSNFTQQDYDAYLGGN